VFRTIVEDELMTTSRYTEKYTGVSVLDSLLVSWCYVNDRSDTTVDVLNTSVKASNYQQVWI